MLKNIRKRIGMPALHIAMLSIFLFGCGGRSSGPGAQAPSLPVMKIERSSPVVQREYSSLLEGVVTVEVRPQVDGTLREIAIDEGAFVKRGQLLFGIDDRVYREELKSAVAARNVAKASLEVAGIEVERLRPLVKNKVVSQIQLKQAIANHRSAKASLEKAEAAVQAARINLGYTRITAPVDGYIGDIPFRIGSLVSKNQPEQLTTLTDVHEIRAYFSMSEVDFVHFRQQYPGSSIEEKLALMPPVTLLLADGSRYPLKGRLDAVSGQFDRTTASVMFRATFPNPDGVLRSGNTGKVKVPYRYENVVQVPQAGTADLQDRIFVVKVGEGNAVTRAPITVIDRSNLNYIVSGGLEEGEMIVLSGFSRLPDGAVINPQLAGEGEGFGEGKQN
ncbi:MULTISPECIES: efflux RND transporter periplasmic adaptor subunit [Prosthecochloris]|uniref:Efflux transporter periplasmic adaptor subunit n=2 Tax=Prosthecochloris TaxID=1101 RepID=A0A317T6Q9_9CHLB|nr:MULTISPECIES: efflux RND transporter periplasmic adaptor subunit [Prosthecochloris]PWW81940.1 efflux transporter periplasmic adaptor subunit [Prosthecochloris marina]UZJ36603.1 efflux RND transporter periplasmic adaptor subunit [Prosthecochloris sp. SCSIO W1103]